MYCKIILCFLVCAELGEGTKESALRAIGGRDAKPSEFPFVVRMLHRTTYKFLQKTKISHTSLCTASVITPIWSLTAAHCLSDFSGVNPCLPQIDIPIKENEILQIFLCIVISYGSSKSELNDNKGYSRVLSLLRVPQNYYAAEFQNDVALLKTEPIAINSYGKISAVEISSLFGHEVWAMGYGNTNNSDGKLNSTLYLNKSLQVVKVMLTRCNDDDKVLEVDMLLLCAAHKCGEPAYLCSGDSGGPLIHSSGIVAINSMAIIEQCHMNDNKRRFPLVVLLQPISPFVDWIENQVTQDT